MASIQTTSSDVISSENAALQQDELLALESIVPPEQVKIQRPSYKTLAQVVFEIPVTLPPSSVVSIDSTAGDDEAGPSTPRTVDLQLQHLPPISLAVSLPSSSPPYPASTGYDTFS